MADEGRVRWYTCIDCPPHATTDHSMYRTDGVRGRGKCLRDECPCKAFRPDDAKPIPFRPKRKDFPSNYIPDLTKGAD